MDLKKGVGDYLERSESGSGNRYEYPYILKRGGHVLKSGGGTLK